MNKESIQPEGRLKSKEEILDSYLSPLMYKGTNAYTEQVLKAMQEYAAQFQTASPVRKNKLEKAADDTGWEYGNWREGKKYKSESHKQAFIDGVNWRTSQSQSPVSEDGWISVKDKLPPKETKDYVVFTDFGGIAIAWYALFSIPETHKKSRYEFRVYKRFGQTDGDYGRNYNITHWRQLPLPPGQSPSPVSTQIQDCQLRIDGKTISETLPTLSTQVEGGPTRETIMDILKSAEENAHRNVGTGCNYESYILPTFYPLIVRKLLQTFTPQPVSEEELNKEAGLSVEALAKASLRETFNKWTDKTCSDEQWNEYLEKESIRLTLSAMITFKAGYAAKGHDFNSKIIKWLNYDK